VSKVRVCFLGTPEFAVHSLQRLLEDEHYEIVGVVTQPDRPAGRKMQLTPSPVKQFALAHHLRLISPDKVRDDLILQEIAKWGAEVAVVVAFGQILPEKFMALFQFGAVNVHGSLLPKWRGAAPIQRSIEAGELEGGVALQKIVKELDAGDVIGIRRLAVGEFMTSMEAHDQLAVLGADLLHVELMDYVRGNLAPTPQDVSKVSFAKKIDKAESLIDWKKSAGEIHHKIRALTMGPGSYTLWQGKRLKVLRTQHRALNSAETYLKSKGYLAFQCTATAIGDRPGEICGWDEEAIYVQTGNGVLALLEVQPESRSKISVRDFLKSNPFQKGEVLGGN
jgi:methionyl-tRNA formyltransferase